MNDKDQKLADNFSINNLNLELNFRSIIIECKSVFIDFFATQTQHWEKLVT